MAMRQAEAIKLRVEALNASLISKCPLDGDTAAWVAGIGDDLAEKLGAVGLIPKRETGVLGEFLDGDIDQRTDAKPRTLINLGQGRDRLIAFFGRDRSLGSITQGDADAWALWLQERFSESTAGRTVRHARLFFKSAVRKRLIPSTRSRIESVIEGEGPQVLRDAGRDALVLDACPDTNGG
jgi:hypothetical protein